MKNLSTFCVILWLLFAGYRISYSQTDIGGELSASTTLTKSGSPYLVNTITVPAGITLTIEAGAVLKFKGAWENINVYGTLKVNGTANDPVFFTSIKDDSDGNDSNADGNASVPAKGDWAAVILRATSSGNQLNHTYLRYGGGAGTSSSLEISSGQSELNACKIDYSVERGITIYDCSPDIHDCSFTGNQTDGMYIHGLDATKTLNFYNNTFTDNVNWAVNCNLKENSADITLSGNSSTGSAHNGFGIFGALASDVTFDGNDGFPFIVNTSVVVREGASLKFTAGTVIKFNYTWDNMDVYGTLITDGSVGYPVVFTSLKDDVYGGDTNGDLDATAAGYGDWAAVILRATSSGNQLDHTYLRYGGGAGTSSSLEMYSGQSELNACKIDYSVERGINIYGCSPDIHDCSFTGNQTDGMYIYGLDATKTLNFYNNTFTDNVNWAVNCDLKENSAHITLSGNSSTGSAHNGFGIFGALASDVTFDGNDGFPFIVNTSVVVREGASLKFTAGTVIKFNYTWDNMDVYGTLITDGSVEYPVVFTSLKDDMYGGDTNSDLDATAAGYGDWAAVILRATSSGNQMDHTYLRYGGGAGTSSSLEMYSGQSELNACKIDYSVERGINIYGCSPDIHDCSFTGNQTDGMYIHGLDATKTLNFFNNSFTDNVNWAVNCNLKENSADITLSGNISSGSAHNGFGLYGNIAGNIRLTGQVDFPFIVNGSVTVREGKKLTIAEGTGVKFNSVWDRMDVSGTLDATGTYSHPIYFTSLSDDHLGGDSNSDGNATEPSPGDWSGIFFRDISKGNILKNAIVRYAGGAGTSAAIDVYTSNVSVDSSEVSYSVERGFFISGANPVIQRSKISNNQTDGIYTTSGALPTLSHNQIVDNGNYGVYNADGTVDVDARNNWWGHSTGPYHPTLNPSGQGNKVTDHVLFNPWHTTTSVTEIPVEDGLALGQHYPNPATGKVTVPFELEKTARVLLQVVNMDGKILNTVLNETRTAGSHQVTFPCEKLTNGTYLLRLTSGNISRISRLVILN